MNASEQRLITCERLAEDIADPYLRSRKIFGPDQQEPLALSDQEARASLVYLGIQWEDDSRDKGITKICFDALVRSSLRGTSNSSRKTRDQILEIIQAILPSHRAEYVTTNTLASLERLKGTIVRYSKKTDSYSLDAVESHKIVEKLAEVEKEDGILSSEIRNLISNRLESFPRLNASIIEDLIVRVRRILESFLVNKGENFVQSVKLGQTSTLGLDGLKDHVIKDISVQPAPRLLGGLAIEVCIDVVSSLLYKPSLYTQTYLRRLSDSYTLMAFLRETPDVLSAFGKMFSYGEIWLDTTILLGIVAETLLENRTPLFTNLINAANEAGLELRVTEGVLEELLYFPGEGVCHAARLSSLSAMV